MCRAAANSNIVNVEATRGHGATFERGFRGPRVTAGIYRTADRHAEEVRGREQQGGRRPG